MTTDAIGFTLALATIGVSMIAVRYRNMLFMLGAAAFWAAFLSFLLAETTAGLNWQKLMIIAISVFIIAFLIISVMSRRGMVGEAESNEQDKPKRAIPSKSLMQYNGSEYRNYIRSRMGRK